MKALNREKILRDFKRAYQDKKSFLDEAEEDFEFALGQQWDEKDVSALQAAGVRALTFNKIRPKIFLLTGIESQNRTDFKAFPEGKEDSVIAEIATGLLKNIMKNSLCDYKVSEQFEDGVTCGESYLEPYLAYPDDLLYGKLNWTKDDYCYILVDPNSREYDLSDAEYVCKITYDLTKDKLKHLFPKQEGVIDNLSDGKLDLDSIGRVDRDNFGVEIQEKGYNDSSSLTSEDDDEPGFDLLEYYYKKYVAKYYVLNFKLKKSTEAETEQEAKNYLKAIMETDPKAAAQIEIAKKIVPEIWVAAVVGGHKDILENKLAWSYPKWKGFPFFPYFARRATARVKSQFRKLLKQGIARGMKDGQREYNKRRTQELRILNTSANAGWVAEEGAWVDRDKVEQFGSSPGVNLEYKKGYQKPERITPAPLSQGHAQLAAENNADMKEDSGINTDLLAMQEGGSDSGRAIALRQKQGLVMVQQLFDHLSLTKRLIGKFCLTQLSEIYDVEAAINVMGEAFLQENFSVPVMVQMQGPNGEIMQQPQIDPMTGQPVMQLDQKAIVTTFNAVLNDPNLQNYNVTVGEGANNETVRYSNYLELLEMVKLGLPIPPEVMIDESNISNSSKENIKAAFARAAQEQANAQPKKKSA